MRVLMFLPRFAGPIFAGTNRQTIRARTFLLPEDPVSLRVWSGKPYRSPQQEIRPPVVVEAVRPIFIGIRPSDNRVFVRIGDPRQGYLSHDETCRFVRRDGFSCISDFIDHWDDKGVCAFEGVLIEWVADEDKDKGGGPCDAA